GVKWLRTIDPYNVQDLIKLLKDAYAHTKAEDGGIAVIIARHPCLIRYPEGLEENRIKVEITDDCNGCRYCIDHFECPALLFDEENERALIDRKLCIDCGVCINVCARGAIVEVE
ncbi:MAG: indolepyruvate oxidoreductase, partial [Candidatus Aminicenantes bacterium]|nr:indolepyruvate oxidoreductase [Candidatus Aminicenantes bacterium]